MATKSTGLDAALTRIEAGPDVVVPLLNGLDHMAVLRRRLGAAASGGGDDPDRVRPAADRGRVCSPARPSGSSWRPMTSRWPTLRTGSRRRCAWPGSPRRSGDSEAQVLWSKLVRLNALACTTSAADSPIGLIRSDPGWRPLLEACIAETAAVANADGARIDGADLLAELDTAPAELGSSMRRDIAAGRAPELDAIPGSVLRAADRHGLACPTIELLTERIAERAGIGVPAR